MRRKGERGGGNRAAPIACHRDYRTGRGGERKKKRGLKKKGEKGEYEMLHENSGVRDEKEGGGEGKKKREGEAGKKRKELIGSHFGVLKKKKKKGGGISEKRKRGGEGHGPSYINAV